MSYSKNNLAFIDHFFHKKTKSSNFLRTIFSKNYNIRNFWGTKFKKEQIQSYCYILFFQVFPSVWTLISLRKSKIIWVPMYDSLSNMDPNIWRICSYFSNLKILSFSKKINQLCVQNNLNYLYCRYFLKPHKNKISKNKKIKILFWYRGQIKFTDWIKYINLKDVEYIIYYTLVDPFYKKEKFTKYDIKKYKLKIIKGNYKSSKKKFLQLLDNSDVFVSPRTKEGIGMSFLEALSRSVYLIAYDNSTMSDYITNDKLGYLIREKKNKNKPLKLSYIKNFKKYRFKYSQSFYNEFISKKKNIETIYNFDSRNSNQNFSITFLELLIYNIMFEIKYKTIKFIRNFLNIQYEKL